MNKFETKYFNTANIMDEALINLLENKEYEFISITEICKKAGVNRATFYLHYNNMDDLLEETITFVNKKFISSFSKTTLANTSIKELSIEEKMFITPEYLIPLLLYVKKNSKILKLYKKIPNLFKTDQTYNKFKIDFF